MIARTNHLNARSVLRLGDEPVDLALGRLLLSQHSGGDRPPLVRFPRKGVVPGATDLGGESAEWLLRSTPIPLEQHWLLEIAGMDRPPAGDAGGAREYRPLSDSAARDIRVLLAAARRSAAHDLRYAFLTLSGSPTEVRNDPRLRAFREEVNRAVGTALKTPPTFGWKIALVFYWSAESVEDIVAARWRDRLSGRVVLAANPGYEGGLVSYAFRAAPGVDAARIIESALPARSPPPRIGADRAAGRGMLAADRFEELLAALRIGRANHAMNH